jgi:hypothetical protein
VKGNKLKRICMPNTGVQLLLVGLFFVSAMPAYGIPAFARKYGLPCSACHEAWPMLNNFGQTFKDNGYQLGNGRDAPIYQEPAYWPIMFRTTPEWHRENDNRQVVDVIPGNASSGQVESPVTTSGFDLPGVDAITAGTLYNNISFFVQPFIGNNGLILSQAWARIDNLAGSHWLNLKLGKFELDLPISQERILTLNQTGGIYYNYLFTPPGDNNFFEGIGLPQLGVELLGHSANDSTRYSVAMVTDSNGGTGLPSNQDYDVYANVNQSFETPWFGRQQVGAYGFVGKSPTFFQTSGGSPIPGTGMGNRSFYRAGAYGHWFVNKFDFFTFYMHGSDNVFLGNSVPANQPASLPLGAAGPAWNGGFIEGHYNPNSRLIFISRYELVRMSREANANLPGFAGNLDTWTVGYRWYPIMSPRAGLAWLQEYSRIYNPGAAPLSGRDDIRDSYLMGFDFDF